MTVWCIFAHVLYPPFERLSPPTHSPLIVYWNQSCLAVLPDSRNTLCTKLSKGTDEFSFSVS